ncbi:stomatin-like protein [Uliginosibacterium sediminicola]|jgi:regulator of protease activity HflC (stomatin/prohibitin superfamily)|uniref:Stomatin-like protein n=1 Tax=Uliginosibacterium sediminicola TaxID=2024550 RepID=A0ABU9Z1J8_9RHOO
MIQIAFALALLVVVFFFVAQAIRIVPQQTVFIVERLGKFHEQLHAGLHFLVPFIDRVAYRHSIKEVPMDVAPQICITKDNTQVHIDGILYYQITDPRLASYGTANYEFAIEQLAKTMLRSEAGKRELDLLLEARSEINQAVVAALDEASGAWGVKVLRYEVKDITPPESILQAMELQIKAVREKRAVIARSEGERQEQINRAEGAQQAAVMTSDGERQAAINRAEGEARSIALVADATASAIRVVAAAIQSDGGDKAIQLKVAEKYVESFGQIAKTGNTVVVPADLGNMAGLISAAMSIVGNKPAS